jgi:GntR family transcriptional regulator
MNNLLRKHPLPLYAQLMEALHQEIRSRGLKPGDQLPTESALEAVFGVSRTTIRQALSELELRGTVERIQGKGTFVARPRITHFPLLTSFSQNMRTQGLTPSRRVLDSKLADAPESIATELGLQTEDRKCRFLRRLLFADDQAVGLAETWLPTTVVGTDDEILGARSAGSASLYEILQGPPLSLVLDRGAECIYSSTADSGQAFLLECSTGDPVLVVERITRDQNSAAVEWTRMTFVGARYQYRVEMSRSRSGPSERGTDEISRVKRPAGQDGDAELVS